MFREMLQTYKHILVDECQDTNPIQYSIMKKMRGKTTTYSYVATMIKVCIHFVVLTHF